MINGHSGSCALDSHNRSYTIIFSQDVRPGDERESHQEARGWIVFA